DFHVTGVQTCALPISPTGCTVSRWPSSRTGRSSTSPGTSATRFVPRPGAGCDVTVAPAARRSSATTDASASSSSWCALGVSCATYVPMRASTRRRASSQEIPSVAATASRSWPGPYIVFIDSLASHSRTAVALIQQLDRMEHRAIVAAQHEARSDLHDASGIRRDHDLRAGARDRIQLVVHDPTTQLGVLNAVDA